MNDILKDFLAESLENLAQMDLDLLALEKEPSDRETLARVFRAVHTLKGTAGFLGFGKLEALTHAGENLLSRLREGKLALNREIISALLAVGDAVRKMLASIEAAGSEGEGDFTELIRALQDLTRGEGPSPRAEEAGGVSPAAETLAAPALETLLGPVSDSTIRVDVGLLDKLMNLVGELVLSRNQIIQLTAGQEDAVFTATTQHLNLITTELQEGVMRTRMQPIGNVWSRFPRVVRDLAAACGKQVRLDMEGKETELDKTIIEAIRDPLTHLLRNSIDHGIEAPAERQARGKLAEGRIALRAFHEGGKVNIEMTDDGAGIDPARIRERALESKLVGPEQAARMSEREILQFIFVPGFSTAARVTNVSGRGVGMDVVRTNIEKIGGTVDVQSKPGQGTTVRMKIPLTLAIIPALTVTSGGDRYAIPQVNLLELVRLDGEQAVRAIEYMHGAPVYRLRGNLLALAYLSRELGVEEAPSAENVVNIVVLQADDRQFGLVVESIHDTEEIVVKPLQQQLKGTNVYAGATIMGDGKVALILDVVGLAQRANVIAGIRERVLNEKTEGKAAVEVQRWLLFAAGDGGRMAIPLSQVARLEEFARSTLEKSGGSHVVQYRDAILPLFHIDRVLSERRRRRRNGEKKAAADDTLQVVVYSSKGKQAGLVVGRILDIVEDTLAVRARSSRPGVLFTAVIQERVTEVLDIEAIIRTADPRFFEQLKPQEATA